MAEDNKKPGFTTDADSSGIFEMPSVTKLLNRKSLGLGNKSKPPGAPPAGMSAPPGPPMMAPPPPIALDSMFASNNSTPAPPSMDVPPPAIDLPPPSMNAPAEIEISLPPPALNFEEPSHAHAEEGVSQIITLELPEANEPSLVDQIRLTPSDAETASESAAPSNPFDLPPPGPPGISEPSGFELAAPEFAPPEFVVPDAVASPAPISIEPSRIRLRSVTMSEVRQKIRARTLDLETARASFKASGSAFEKALMRMANGDVKGIAILEAGNSTGGTGTLLGLKYAASTVMSQEGRFTSACEGVQFFPSIAPDLWQSMSKTGFFELPPPEAAANTSGTTSTVRSPRTALRTAFGAKPGDWITLAMVGAGITARVLIILSGKSIQTTVTTELPSLRSASGTESVGMAA